MMARALTFSLSSLPNESSSDRSAQQARFTQREQTLHDLFVRAQGDAQAYASLLTALSTHLRAFFRRKLTRVPDEVEDLVQETLIAIHNQRHTYDVALPFTAWAFAIARYKLVDRYRTFARHEAKWDSLDDEESHFAVSTDDDAHDAKRDVMTLLDTLPEKQRASIQWVKIEGLSIAEASAKTGLSESAVKVSIHRGLKALATRMQRS